MTEQAVLNNELRRRDRDVLDVLSKTRKMNGTTLSLLTKWWQQNKMEQDEDLLEFMTRHDVVNDQAKRMMDLIEKGFLRVENVRGFISSQGETRLEQMLADFEAQQMKEMAQRKTEEAARRKEEERRKREAEERARQEAEEAEAKKAEEEAFLDADKAEPEAETGDTEQVKLKPLPNKEIRKEKLNVPQKSDNSADQLPKIGNTLGKCVLTRELSWDRPCTLFAGLHQTLKITVAVKVFPALAEDVTTARDHFMAEARNVARVHNRNIVRILDYEDGNVPYIVMEYVSGLSILDLIRRSGSIAPEHALKLITQTAEGLACAANYNVVHGSLRPANILVDGDGIVKLTGLWTYRLLTALKQNTSDRNSAIGVREYTAPELLNDPQHRPDFQTDVYSLGTTFYHMLTGRLPQNQDLSSDHMIDMIRSDKRFSTALGDVFAGMVESNREKRYNNSKELLSDLKQALKVQQTDDEEDDKPKTLSLKITSILRDIFNRAH